MKKIFFSALAAISLAACVQEATVDVPQNDAIAFENAFIDNATRAAVDPSFDINTLNAFKVWAYVNAPDGVVFEGKEVSRTGAGAPWTYEGTQYWAPEKPYNFEAIAPAEGNWELATNYADPTVLSFTNANGTEDLLYATAQQTGAAIGTANQSVKFSFGHMLSKVKFTFNNGFLTDNVTVKVTDIKMVAPKKADIDLSKEADMAWVNASETVELAFGDVADLNLAVNSNECADERFTIPGLYDYTISFNLEIVMGAQTVYDVEKTSTVKGVELEMGKAYNFVAEISPATLDFEAIEFKVVEIEDWITSGAPSNDSQVAGAELQAAAQLGGTYKLTKDVVIDAPVVVPAGVNFVLDLNGNNITSSGDVFEVAGGNLTINGEGTVYAATNNGAPYCAVWAYGDGYVRINGGEYKIGYPAGDYNDLIYAKDNAKIDIYGGYFHNSGSENAFVLNLKDNSNADITVYGGTYVNFNPENNRSEGANTNFVAEGYIAVAKGEKYNVVRGTAVATKDALKEAINNPENTTIVFNAPINFDNEALKIRNNVVIDMTNNQFTSGVNQKLYAVNVGGCEAVLDNANINGGGINAWGNAKVTLNSGKVYNNNTNTSRYSIWAYGEETVVTVTGGDFTWSKPNNRLAWVADGATLKIEGGNFAVTGNVPNIPFVNQGFQTSNGGSIIITGGNFGFNPSAYVADGYVATLSGSIWTVSKQ